jgi:hypothetical protein
MSDLPLLDPLRGIPVIGNPLADLVQPDLRVIVDLGYGDGYANVPTPASPYRTLSGSPWIPECCSQRWACKLPLREQQKRSPASP